MLLSALVNRDSNHLSASQWKLELGTQTKTKPTKSLGRSKRSAVNNFSTYTLCSEQLATKLKWNFNAKSIESQKDRKKTEDDIENGMNIPHPSMRMM